MTSTVPDPVPEGPPQTGHAAIDTAMAQVAELDPASVADHHDQLRRAHETLDRTLNAEPSADPGPPSTR